MTSPAGIATPFFLLSEHRLGANFRALDEAFRTRLPNLVVGYSFKTNPLPWVIKRLKREGAWAEVVSDREFDLAERLGYRPNEIILNGPVKGFDCLRRALDGGATVNLDALSEVEWIEKHSPTGKTPWRVGLRVNFDLEAACPGETVAGKEPGRFGFCLENGNLLAAVQRLLRIPHVKVCGFHGHHSTRSRSLSIFGAIARTLAEASHMLPHAVEYVDVGGGFFGGREGDERYAGFPTMADYAAEIKSHLERAGLDARGCRLIVEPGACIVATAFEYYCTVVDVRDVRGTRIVTVDGSRLDVAPNSSAPLQCRVEAAAPRPEQAARQVICGYSCIEMDRLATLAPGSPEVRSGDVLVFEGVGGYGMSLAPLFIRYLKPVYVQPEDGSGPFAVRTEWTVNEAVSGCRVDC